MVNFLSSAYWKRKYQGKADNEGWYILTNLSHIEEVIKVYQARFGIEALFKDCKTGGYNLEGSKATVERLTRLVLLIAIAYTWACLKGDKTRRSGQQALCMSPPRFEKNAETTQQLLDWSLWTNVDYRLGVLPRLDRTIDAA